MSESQQSAAAAVQGMVQGGQALAQGFLDFLNRQQAALQGMPGTAASAAPFPFPDGQALAGLQREFLQRHAELWSSMLRRSVEGAGEPSGGAPEPGDRRFSAPEWGESSHFDYLRRAYLINAEFLRRVADLLPVADGHAKTRLRFLTRQYADAMAPSNFAATNPEFVRTALETQGASITAGIRNLIDDLTKGRVSMTDESAFEVGRNLAVTPGSVVYENELIQLIQYAPTTATVAARPFLIVPPCINKFYILDLQAENSFVRFAVERGHTVFLISWRNVGADLGHLTWDDYLEKGPLTAFRVVREICGVEKVNALGFCVGGTIISSALAVAAARGEASPIASLTLLTTLLDFSDAGEISCFVDEASVAAREAAIGRGGLLQGRELMTVFSSLRANDLIWQYVVGNYLKGKTPDAFDILYWNCDSTNLPGPFLTYYLRNMYLSNNLRVPDKLEFCGVKCNLGRIDAPAYILATREDHIVPWRGAYLSRQLLGGETTFVLGASGHIAGAINPASKNRRSHWTNSAPAGSADEWMAGATEQRGSWWNHWIEWLDRFRDGERPARARLGSDAYPAAEPAPGRYVKQRA